MWRHTVRGQTVPCPRFGIASLERCRECVSLVRIETGDESDDRFVVVCVGDVADPDGFTWQS